MARTEARAARRAPGAAPPKRPTPPRALPEPPVEPLSILDAWIVVGVLALVWLMLFAPNLGGGVFVAGDAAVYRPYADFARERFATVHDRTLWNPYVFLGIPSAASLADPRPQWAPGTLLAAWDGLTASPVTALRLELFAVFAGACAMAWLARRLWMAPPPAMVLAGATLMAASGVMGPLAFGHDAQVVCLALTPVALLACCRLFVAPPERLLREAAGLALALAALALAGHPQFLAYGVLLVLVLALERGTALAAPRRLAAFAAAAMLGMAMSAGWWWPALAYGPISVRARVAGMARMAEAFSANGLDLLALAWPRAAGFGGADYHGGLRATDFPNHVGVVVVVLAIAGAFAWPATRGRRTARALMAFTLFALLASLGGHLPVMDALLRFLPILGSFRTPVTWMMPASLVLGLLAARGMAGVAARAPGGTARALAWVLVLGSVAEMSAVTIPILRGATGSVSALAPPRPVLSALVAARDSLHRSFAFEPANFFSNHWIAWRVRSVSGLHGSVMSEWNDLRASGLFKHKGFLRAISMRWMFDLPPSLAGSPGLRAMPGGGGELVDALPRAYAVRRVDALADRALLVAALGEDRFDATQRSFTMDVAAAGDYPGSGDAAIEWRRDVPDRLVLQVSARESCFVVVADAWAPGWSARVDGRPTPIFAVNAALRGVRLPAGSHGLEMAYLPPGWAAGRLLAGVGWLAWLALAAWALALGVGSRTVGRQARMRPAALAGEAGPPPRATT